MNGSPEKAQDLTYQDVEKMRLQFLLAYLRMVKEGRVIDEDTYESLTPRQALEEAIVSVRDFLPTQLKILLGLIGSPFFTTLDERLDGTLEKFNNFDKELLVEEFLRHFEAQYTFEDVEAKLANE